MKCSKLLLLSAVLFISFSCSKDDDPKPVNLEETTLSFTADAQVVSPPSGMLTSDDPQAQMAASWIQQANLMGTYLQYMESKPAGATKSSTRITASNGRSKASGDFVAYTWSDASSGYSVGYQISENSNSYVFEIFLKFPGSTDWLKYFHAEEKTDRSSGFMKIYDIFGSTDSNTNVILNYSWTRSGDVLSLDITAYGGSFLIQLEVNEKTKAGNVVYTLEGDKLYEIEWDAQGNGSWAYYGDDGEVLDEGTWTI